MKSTYEAVRDSSLAQGRAWLESVQGEWPLSEVKDATFQIMDAEAHKRIEEREWRWEQMSEFASTLPPALMESLREALTGWMSRHLGESLSDDLDLIADTMEWQPEEEVISEDYPSGTRI